MGSVAAQSSPKSHQPAHLYLQVGLRNIKRKKKKKKYQEETKLQSTDWEKIFANDDTERD